MIEIILTSLATIFGGIMIEMVRRISHRMTRSKLELEFEKMQIALGPGEEYRLRWRVTNVGRTKVKKVLFAFEIPSVFDVMTTPELTNVKGIGDLLPGEQRVYELNIRASEAVEPGVYKLTATATGADPNMIKVDTTRELQFKVVQKVN